MADAPTCTTCPTYRPDSTPRIPNRPTVCDGDRTLLDRHLADIANLHADLSNPEEPLVDARRYERFDRNGDSLGPTWADPLAVFGGVAPINSRSKAPTVSGSRERPIPIAVATLDLQAGARVPSIPTWAQTNEKIHRQWAGDQIGHLSAATILDQWVRHIRDTMFPGHHLPKASVDELVMWLRNRTEDACDRHPAIAEFAEEIRNLRSALRVAAGEVEPRPELCDGVACSRCDVRSLFHVPGDEYRAECASCGLLYTIEEYDAWTQSLVGELRLNERLRAVE